MPHQTTNWCVMKQLLTRTQAAEYIGRDRRTLEIWERRGIVSA